MPYDMVREAEKWWTLSSLRQGSKWYENLGSHKIFQYGLKVGWVKSNLEKQKERPSHGRPTCLLRNWVLILRATESYSKN